MYFLTVMTTKCKAVVIGVGRIAKFIVACLGEETSCYVTWLTGNHLIEL